MTHFLRLQLNNLYSLYRLCFDIKLKIQKFKPLILLSFFVIRYLSYINLNRSNNCTPADATNTDDNDTDETEKCTDNDTDDPDTGTGTVNYTDNCIDHTDTEHNIDK